MAQEKSNKTKIQGCPISNLDKEFQSLWVKISTEEKMTNLKLEKKFKFLLRMLKDLSEITKSIDLEK